MVGRSYQPGQPERLKIVLIDGQAGELAGLGGTNLENDGEALAPAYIILYVRLDWCAERHLHPTPGD